jgi:hypothetical protein
MSILLGLPTYHSYKGFIYLPYEDVMDDNVKVYHDVYSNGDRVDVPKWFTNITPYRYVTREEFVNAIDEFLAGEVE